MMAYNCLLDSHTGDICSVLSAESVSTDDSDGRWHFSAAARRSAGRTLSPDSFVDAYSHHCFSYLEMDSLSSEF